MDSSSKRELIQNYDQRQQSIEELANYINEITPDSTLIYLEFKNNNSIDFWIWKEKLKNKFPRNYIFQKWDFDPYNYAHIPSARDSSSYAPLTNSLDSALTSLKWNTSTLKQIKKMLDEANCISVNNGWPAKIGYARSGMGKYSYNVFIEPIKEDEYKNWNDSCQYQLYSPKLALEYGGGAIGPQCFPD